MQKYYFHCIIKIHKTDTCKTRLKKPNNLTTKKIPLFILTIFTNCQNNTYSFSRDFDPLYNIKNKDVHSLNIKATQ